MTAFVLRPRVEDGADGAEQIGKIGRLLFQQGANMRAGRIPVSTVRDDRRDLREGQAETPRAGDESKQVEHVSGIRAITRRCTAGTRDDAARLVQAKRLASDAAALRHIANEQTARHAVEDRPCPMGEGQGRRLRESLGRAAPDRHSDAGPAMTPGGSHETGRSHGARTDYVNDWPRNRGRPGGASHALSDGSARSPLVALQRTRCRALPRAAHQRPLRMR